MSAIPLQRDRTGPRSGSAPRLRLVPPPRKRHTVVFALITVALCGVSVFTTVAVNALAAGDAVRLRELETAVADNERRYAELVAEVAHLEDPARIEAVAVEDLGMVPAESSRFLVIDAQVPEDAPQEEQLLVGGDEADPLKPVLSVER